MANDYVLMSFEDELGARHALVDVLTNIMDNPPLNRVMFTDGVMSFIIKPVTDADRVYIALTTGVIFVPTPTRHKTYLAAEIATIIASTKPEIYFAGINFLSPDYFKFIR
jgi:hypothetical protein